MSASSRRKGSTGELELAHILNDRLGLDVRRTPNSGGLMIPADIIGHEGFSWEVKRQENISIWRCLDQARAQAAEGETPVLAFRRNRSPWFVALSLDDFLGLVE